MAERKPKKGSLVLMRSFLPAFPVGLPAGAFVEIVEKHAGGKFMVKSSRGSMHLVERSMFYMIGEPKGAA